MKTYKTYNGAKKAAGGDTILRIDGGGGHRLYIVGGINLLTSIEVIRGDGLITGNITARHLDRLGNANWCERSEKRPHHFSFPINAKAEEQK